MGWLSGTSGTSETISLRHESAFDVSNQSPSFELEAQGLRPNFPGSNACNLVGNAVTKEERALTKSQF